MLVAAKRKLKADRAAPPSEYERAKKGSKFRGWKVWHEKRRAAKAARKARRAARKVGR